MFREDYIMRIIQQVADFLARIAGHNRKREFDQAISEADRAWTEVLEMPRHLVDVLDSPTIASMLRDPDKMRMASQLLAEEARAVKGKGDPLGGGRLYRRAFELLLEARAIEPRDSDDAVLLELSREVPPGTIDERYR